MGGICPCIGGNLGALPTPALDIDLGMDPEELLKKAATVVLAAAEVLNNSQDKVKLVGEIIFRAFSMALYFKMKEAKHGIEEATKIWESLNKIMGKEYSYAETPDMENSIVEGLGDLHDFLEKIALKPVEAASKAMVLIAIPPAKAVKAMLDMGKEYIEKPLNVIEHTQEFFRHAFRAYHFLQEGDSMAEKAGEEILKAFQELEELEKMFRGEKEEEPMKEDKEIARYRLKVRGVLDHIENMGLKIGDIAGTLEKYGGAMKEGIVPLVKVIMISISDELNSGSDLDGILQNSRWYAGSSLKQIIHNVADSKWKDVLYYCERAFDENVDKKVQEWVGWVLPMQYSGFTGDDVKLYQKVLKVKQWYIRLYELLAETKEMLDADAKRFLNLDKYLPTVDLKPLAEEMKTCVEKTEKTMTTVENYNVMLKYFPKMCKHILLEDENKCEKMREKMLEKIGMSDNASLKEQMGNLMDPIYDDIYYLNIAYKNCGANLKSALEE